MSLSEIVNIAISANTSSPTRVGFGTPLIMRYHTAYAATVREFATLTEMTDAGFAATDPAVLIATKIFSQNPKPAKIKVGKRLSAFTQTIDFTPIKTTEGYVYGPFEVRVGATTTTINYTVLAAATVASIVTALQLLFDAVSGISATDNTTKLTIAADTAGDLVDYAGMCSAPDNMQFKDVTTDPGIAADLAIVEAADPTGWYALLLDSNSEAEILAAAAWTEARSKIFLTNTSDTECVDAAVTNCVLSDLTAGAYARTAVIYSQARLLNWSGAAWAGNRLPSDPGSSTWAFKTLAGVTVDTALTAGYRSAIKAKNGNVYYVVAGNNVTYDGRSSSGEYLDITRLVDWTAQRIQERFFGVLINLPKLPFTDSSVDLARSEVLAQLAEGVRRGGFAADPAPQCTGPKVADVSASNRANRILPDIAFTANFAGAIHNIQMTGVLSV